MIDFFSTVSQAVIIFPETFSRMALCKLFKLHHDRWIIFQWAVMKTASTDFKYAQSLAGIFRTELTDLPDNFPFPTRL